MKIRYFENEVNHSPIIIYGDEPFNLLIDMFLSFSKGELENARIEQLPGYQSINNCSIKAEVSPTDKGIEKISGSLRGNDFVWSMTTSSWEDLAALSEPFYTFSDYSSQWLVGSEVRMDNLSKSSINLVISTYPDGQW